MHMPQSVYLFVPDVFFPPEEKQAEAEEEE